MKVILLIIVIAFGGWYYLVNFHYAPSSDEFLDNYLAKEANSSEEEDEFLAGAPNEYNQQLMQIKKQAVQEKNQEVQEKKSVKPDSASKIRYSAYEESAATYRCDGRTRCTQMHSCQEAKFFQKNCPDVIMDGDGDGIPCESQWCGGGVY
ncbi:MAG: excalibur calcium-binding domain-containing protein [Campylobacterota bacterium]|nr:excalibur calcium-binding domain-containing protein [Campylobacterota bacterium]